jgi:hypothetical protein
MPVGVFYDPETQAIVTGSASDMAASKKFRDAQRRPDVALVIDDLAAVDPRVMWRRFPSRSPERASTTKG